MSDTISALAERRRATMIGLTAVLMWSTLGLFTAASGAVPPFLLNGLCFGLFGTLAIISMGFRPGAFRALRQSPWVILFGTAGLFGYHFFYFTGLRNAPPVEANLINYGWPLLIVLFSGLLPSERLRWYHTAGALLGLSGVALLVTRGTGLSFSGDYALGYAAALAAALFWSSYSVLSRRLTSVPTDTVAAFCITTSVLSFACHMMFEETIWPADMKQWLAVAGLGLFPVGLAFYVWDFGVKRGDIQVLGAAAYAAPLLSTLLLIVFGYGNFTWAVATACGLITLGALLAAKDLIFSRKPVSPVE